LLWLLPILKAHKARRFIERRGLALLPLLIRGC
jgi:hypothetical protein